MGAYYDQAGRQAGNRTSESIDEDMSIALSRRRRIRKKEAKKAKLRMS